MKKLLLILAALIVTQIMGCATTSSSSMTSSSGAELPDIAPYDDPAIPPLDVEPPPVEPVA